MKPEQLIEKCIVEMEPFRISMMKLITDILVAYGAPKDTQEERVKLTITASNIQNHLVEHIPFLIESAWKTFKPANLYEMIQPREEGGKPYYAWELESMQVLDGVSEEGIDLMRKFIGVSNENKNR